MELSLVRMSKLEIILPGRDIPIVKEILAGADVSAYTLIENVSGAGHHGYHQGRLVFNEVASQVMIVSVVPEDRVEPVLKCLMEHFQTHSGVVFISEVKVGRAYYFESNTALSDEKRSQLGKLLEKSKLSDPFAQGRSYLNPL